MSDTADAPIRTITLADNEETRLTLKIYQAGDAILRQDDHQIYISADLIPTLALLLGTIREVAP